MAVYSFYVIINYLENWDKVQYPFTRPSPGFIQDIQDGERYKRQSGPGKFFSVPEHVGLILCTDGVPLFKSSGACITSYLHSAYNALLPVSLAIA